MTAIYLSVNIVSMEDNSGVRRACETWASTTSLHGIPRIPVAKRHWQKLFWAVVFFVAFGNFTFQLVRLLDKYYSYPVSTEIRVQFEDLEFPAVTLCNLNQLRKTQVVSTGGESLEAQVNEMQESITDQISRGTSINEDTEKDKEGQQTDHGTSPRRKRSASFPVMGNNYLAYIGERSMKDDFDFATAKVPHNRAKREISPGTTDTGSGTSSGYSPGTHATISANTTNATNSTNVTTAGIHFTTPTLDTATELYGTANNYNITVATGLPETNTTDNVTSTFVNVQTTPISSTNTQTEYRSSTTGIRESSPTTPSLTSSTEPTTPSSESVRRTGMRTPPTSPPQPNFDPSQEYTRPLYDSKEASWFDNTENTPDASVESVQNLTRLLAGYPLYQRSEMGHSIVSFLQECGWDAKLCGPRDFAQFNSRYYGNCYTFNSGLGGHMKVSQRPGSLHGFAVTLFINQDEYLDAITPSAGVRVTIHHPTKQPFPEENGFDISPGTKTTVSLAMIKISREPEPYSDCKDEEGQDATELLYNKKYSVEACQKSCQQRNKILECGCADVMLAVPHSIRHCTTDQDIRCLSGADENIIRNKTCKYCVEPCRNIIYQTTISSADWPANSYKTSLKKQLSKRNPTLAKALNKEDGVSSNLVRLEIYFRDLRYEHIMEKPAYEIANFLGDIGGQLGLWIGLSIITLVELLELMVNVAAMTLAKRRSKVNGSDCIPKCNDRKTDYIYAGDKQTPFSHKKHGLAPGVAPSYHSMPEGNQSCQNRSLTPVD